MTSKTAKINFITSRAMDIIRTVIMSLAREVMKLIFAVLDVSFNSGHYVSVGSRCDVKR